MLLLLLGVTLATNVALTYALLRSHGTNDGSSSQRRGPSIGTKLPPLEVQRLDGSPEVLSYSYGTGTLAIYVFTPACSWCRRNLANLRVLARAARDRNIRLIGISLDPTPGEYIRKEGIDFPVFIKPDFKTIRAYGFGSTPETLVVNANGVLEKVWMGAFTGKAKAEVEEWIGADLPGLAELSSDERPHP